MHTNHQICNKIKLSITKPILHRNKRIRECYVTVSSIFKLRVHVYLLHLQEAATSYSSVPIFQGFGASSFSAASVGFSSSLVAASAGRSSTFFSPLVSTNCAFSSSFFSSSTTISLSWTTSVLVSAEGASPFSSFSSVTTKVDTFSNTKKTELEAKAGPNLEDASDAAFDPGKSEILSGALS